MFCCLFIIIFILKLVGPSRKHNKPIVIVCMPDKTFITKPAGYGRLPINSFKKIRNYIAAAKNAFICTCLFL